MTPCLRASVVLFACVLAGCGDAPHRNTQEVNFNGRGRGTTNHEPKTTNHAPRVDLEPRSSGELPAALASIEKRLAETQQSNNALQNSFSGVGLQVGKLAEKVDASLVKLEADLQLSVQQTVQAHATANLNAQNTMNATMEKLVGDLSLTVKGFENQMRDLKIEQQAQGAAQMALNAQFQHTTSNLNAGRDNIQFTAEMAKLMEKAFEEMAHALAIACAIVVATVSAATTIVVGVVTVLAHMQGKSIKTLAVETFKIVDVMARLAVLVDTDPRDPTKSTTRRVPPLAPNPMPKEPPHVR